MLPLAVSSNWRVWPVISLVLVIVLHALLTSNLKGSNSAASTNTEWLAIWEAKGASIGDNELASGFNGINLDQWNALVSTIIKPTQQLCD